MSSEINLNEIRKELSRLRGQVSRIADALERPKPREYFMAPEGAVEVTEKNRSYLQEMERRSKQQLRLPLDIKW